MDLISEGNRLLHVQKGNVSVQVLLPVIFRMEKYFINGCYLLSAPLIPDRKKAEVLL